MDLKFCTSEKVIEKKSLFCDVSYNLSWGLSTFGITVNVRRTYQCFKGFSYMTIFFQKRSHYL